VACTGAGYCVIFDPTTQSILKSIKLPVRCHRLVCNRDGTVAYLATLDGPSAVIRVDLEKGSLQTISPPDDPATEAMPVDAEHWVYRCRNIVRSRSYDSPDEVTMGYQAGDVEDLVAIPETHRILVATAAGTILAWDMSSESKPDVLQRYRISIRQLAYSPSARWVAVGLADGRIDVLPCEDEDGALSDVTSNGEVRLLPADQGWLVRTGDNRIQHYSPTRDLLAEFDAPELIAFDADPTGQQFVAFGSDWKLRNGALRDVKAATSADVMEGVRPVVYSPDGRWLAGPPRRQQAPEASPAEGTIGIWSVDPLAPRKNLVGHTNWVTELCWFANSQQLVSIADDYSIRLWDCASATCEGIFEHPMKSSPTAVAVMGDSRRIIVGFDDGDVVVWNADNGREVMTLHAFGDGISSLCVTPDQQRLLVGCASQSAFQIYRTQDWTKVATLDAGCGAIQRLQISPTDGALLVQGRSRHRLFRTDGTSPARDRRSRAGTSFPEDPRFRLGRESVSSRRSAATRWSDGEEVENGSG
jgi:hypothetical protein